MFIYRFLYLFIAAFSISGNIFSQQGDTINRETALFVNKLDEVEVKALYSNIVSRRFPATVYAIQINTTDILLPVNINESFNKIPSVYTHSGTFNTSRITMRGIGTRSLYGTRKINALINDIPLTSGEGDTFIDDIDLQFVSSMEVISGPTSGIYGPSLGGTILLSTKALSSESSVSVNTGSGSFGTFQNFVNLNLARVKPVWHCCTKIHYPMGTVKIMNIGEIPFL
ncbi:MAG: TonB-dependent receptor plug domain-containing protein [Bacteroidales bacterium]|nr:TonB-dependent receptor plug domain-containing protein [Bacteroidales bacterium]